MASNKPFSREWEGKGFCFVLVGREVWWMFHGETLREGYG